MSKEMLELAKRIAERAATNAGVAPELLYAPVLWELQADASRASLPAPEAAPTREEIKSSMEQVLGDYRTGGATYEQVIDAILALKAAPAK